MKPTGKEVIADEDFFAAATARVALTDVDLRAHSTQASASSRVSAGTS